MSTKAKNPRAKKSLEKLHGKLAKTGSKPTRRKPQQRAIVTFTDNEDGTLGMVIEFKPAVKGDTPMTIALDMAMRVARFVKEQASA
ncbi:MAG TPA: hypothetical protein VGE39_00765 [Prosthecobacter sp.]